MKLDLSFLIDITCLTDAWLSSIEQKIKSIGWLVVLGLTALWDSISVYIGPSPKEREKEKRKDRWE